jgi:hypothetical protein
MLQAVPGHMMVFCREYTGQVDRKKDELGASLRWHLSYVFLFKR